MRSPRGARARKLRAGLRCGADTNIVAAINSFGIAPHCVGNDYMWRADIAATVDFVTPYVD